MELYRKFFFLKSSHPGTLQVFFVCGVDHVSISAWKGPGRKFWKSKQDPGYPGYPGLGQMSWIKDMDPLSRWPASTVSPAMEGVRSSDKLCRKNFCCFGCGNRGMSISQYWYQIPGIHVSFSQGNFCFQQFFATLFARNMLLIGRFYLITFSSLSPDIQSQF